MRIIETRKLGKNGPLDCACPGGRSSLQPAGELPGHANVRLIHQVGDSAKRSTAVLGETLRPPAQAGCDGPTRAPAKAPVRVEACPAARPPPGLRPETVA